MDSPTAFVAVALAAVSWDGLLTRAGSRALRHSLDYRVPFNQMGDAAMIQLFDQLLADLRHDGALLDRLTHHVHILEMNGESYRLKTSSASKRRRAGQPAETGETIDPDTGEILNA